MIRQPRILKCDNRQNGAYRSPNVFNFPHTLQLVQPRGWNCLSQIDQDVTSKALSLNLNQARKTFKTSCQQEFPWKISFQIFLIFLDPIPLLNAKLIRFGPLCHENPIFSLFFILFFFWGGGGVLGSKKI